MLHMRIALRNLYTDTAQHGSPLHLLSSLRLNIAGPRIMSDGADCNGRHLCVEALVCRALDFRPELGVEGVLARAHSFNKPLSTLREYLLDFTLRG
jgi:hypothetical protein